MNEELLNNVNNNYELNSNDEEENEEYNLSEEEHEDDNNYNKQNILFCPNKYCNSIPEIYFDEHSSSIYLFCNKNKYNQKHKYYIPLKQYLNDNTIRSSSKLKDEEEKELQEINSKLPDELNQEIEDMKNKIKLQKKYLENLTNIFNSLIKKIVNDYTCLLENKLSILLLQKKIIYTFLKYHTNKNAIKNFQNLSNFMQNMPIPNNTFLNNDENNAFNKIIINHNHNSGSNSEMNYHDNNIKDEKIIVNNLKNILERIKTLSKIFNYFDNTSHNIMSINKRKNVIDVGRVNNLCVLKNGNLCFSSDFGAVNIYKYNNKINNFELVNKIIPLKNILVNYVTQLSNELLVCCSKKLIIGKLKNNDSEYEIHQLIDEFDNFNIVKVIELSNNYLVTYDRGYQISIFTLVNSNQNIIEYQLLYNKINKGEQIYSLLSLPPNNKRNDIEYISTSNDFNSNGNNCIRFYSSEINYKSFDAIVDVNCSRFVDSVIMLSDKILCVGIQNSLSLASMNGIVLININTREIVTFIEEEFPTALYKLKNDLVVIAFNKSSYDDDELIPAKKINFYYMNNDNELVFISEINSRMKNFICSFGQLNNLDELIIVGSTVTNVFQ
jgi:hypothetical protein